MKNLEKLIHKLNTDKFAAVSIFDFDAQEYVCKNKTSESIIEAHETAENFFNSLESENLRVEPKRKNGSAFKLDGEIFTIKPDTAIQMPAPVAPIAPVEQIKKKKKKKNKGFGGLGFAETISLNVKASQVDNLLSENRDLKSENRDLKKENYDLKEKEMIGKWTKESSDTRNQLLGTVLEQAPKIAAAMGLGAPQNGLNAPGEILTETQKKLIEILKISENGLTEILIGVCNKINAKTENDPFETEFLTLLQNHKIIL